MILKEKKTREDAIKIFNEMMFSLKFLAENEFSRSIYNINEFELHTFKIKDNKLQMKTMTGGGDRGNWFYRYGQFGNSNTYSKYELGEINFIRPEKFKSVIDAASINWSRFTDISNPRYENCEITLFSGVTTVFVVPSTNCWLMVMYPLFLRDSK